MDWTSQPDVVPRCPGELGVVQDGEEVARLVHSKLKIPYGDPFNVSQFCPDTGRPVSNECGRSSGVSVDRCSTMNDEELRQRSKKLAAEKPNRTSDGAMVAKVGLLRKIEADSLPGEQVVFVYDDASPTNPFHAVIRIKSVLGRPEQRLVRDRIRDVFSRVVLP